MQKQKPKKKCKNKKGVGFGTIYAIKGITHATAPFSMGFMYKQFKSINAPSLAFFIAAFFVLLALPVVIFPLKKGILKRENEKILNNSNDSNQSLSQIEILNKNNNDDNDIINDNLMAGDNQTEIKNKNKNYKNKNKNKNKKGGYDFGMIPIPIIDTDNDLAFVNTITQQTQEHGGGLQDISLNDINDPDPTDVDTHV